MSAWTYIIKSLRYYWRTHLGVVLGVAVACAVLVGALAVGDSVSHSLESIALSRLGQVQMAILTQDRLFRTDLAEDLAATLAEWVPGAGEAEGDASGRIEPAPLLMVRGMVRGGPEQLRANRVSILGVDERFWRSGESEPLIGSRSADGSPNQYSSDTVVLNDRLAAKLGAGVGDLVLLRVEKPSLMPADAPLSTESDRTVAFRLEVAAIAGPDQFGHFSPRADQIAPLNAFVPLDWLGEKVEMEGRANAMLLGPASAVQRHGELSQPEGLQAAIEESWQLADADLEVRALSEEQGIELRSGRIFLEPSVVRAAEEIDPAALGVLTYFVNELRAGEHSTPYSMVSAVGYAFEDDSDRSLPPPLPPRIGEGDIVLNAWLADDLGIGLGDELDMTYYAIGPMRALEERTERLRVQAIVAIDGLAADRELMPPYPGLADADDCAQWEPGIPIELARIRDKDEQYWDDYRGTPKAFVSLETGRRLWRNRFGDLTAVRSRVPEKDPPEAEADRLAGAYQATLDPADVGLFFSDVRGAAMAAGDQAIGFGGLFLGFSFFLIFSALMLTGLLFVFGVEQRSEEIGTLLAVGLRPRRVRGLMMLEAGVLSLVGSAIGGAAGMLYTRGIIRGLTTIWRDAVGTSALTYHAEPRTVVLGMVISVFVSALTIWLMIRRQGRRQVRELLTGCGSDQAMGGGSSKPGRRLWLLGGLGLGLALIMLIAGLGRGRMNPEMFFGAGGLLLISGLLISQALIGSLARASDRSTVTLGSLALRGCMRRRGRSLTTIGLLAAGSFLIIAVGANRKDAQRDAHARSAGTGGFEFYGESTLPVLQDLNSPAGREVYGLEEDEMAGVGVVPLRMNEGDEASCLNLNRAQQPRLFGVNVATMVPLGPFTFNEVALDDFRDQPWRVLAAELPDGTVAAVGDEATVIWALGLGLGDLLTYKAENGELFNVQIVGMVANSILQGGLIISERNFVKCFPSAAGYRAFLIDAPPERMAEVSRALGRGLEPVGLDLTPAAERLAAFNAVENTYLSIFLILGGMGMLLGCVGLGMVVLRNVLERRSEMALLRAVGFELGRIRRLILTEHGWLLLAGLGCGVVAALLAVLPVLVSPGAEVPVTTIVVMLAAIFVSGLAWTLLATFLALRGPLLSVLREE